MSSDEETELPELLRATLDKPFDGLFGDTAELRVLQEIVADPYSDYTQQDLMDLTGLSDPSVRKGVNALMEQGILRNVSSARRRPLYRAILDSRKLTALTFLGYAALDERTGSRSMDDAVKHYCDCLPASVELMSLAAESTFQRYEPLQYDQDLSASNRTVVITERA